MRAGLIDGDFVGEAFVMVYNNSMKTITIPKNQKLFQLVPQDRNSEIVKASKRLSYACKAWNEVRRNISKQAPHVGLGSTDQQTLASDICHDDNPSDFPLRMSVAEVKKILDAPSTRVIFDEFANALAQDNRARRLYI